MKRLIGNLAAFVILILCVASFTLPSLSYADECQSCPPSFTPSPDGNIWDLLGGTPATGCRYGGWYKGDQDYNCATVSWDGTQYIGNAYHYCSLDGTGGEYWGPVGFSCAGAGGGGLTPEQIAAIQQIKQALQILQTANSTASDYLNLIYSFSGSLASLQNSLGNTQSLAQQASSTIRISLVKLIGYLGQASLLDQQAKGMIARQVGEILNQQSIIQGNNRNVQGSSMGDPVFIASGIEDLKRVDFEYKTFTETIKLQRRYRSSNRDQKSSFGKGWFFNYDTNIITGRKPYIKGRELLTTYLDSQAQDLVSQATVAYKEALTALTQLRQYQATAQTLADQINTKKNQIATHTTEINQQVSIANDAAASAQSNAAIADTAEGYADAQSAQNIASQIGAMASDAATKNNSASVANSSAQQALILITQLRGKGESNVVEASQKKDATNHYAVILSAEAVEAATEARAEEERFPNDPYPDDPTVYFGPGFLKLITNNGTPVLYEQQIDGSFKAISDNGRDTTKIYEQDNGYQVVDKHNKVTKYTNTGTGIALLSKKIDSNGNETSFDREGLELTAVIDPMGRQTTIVYNNLGYIAAVTDPLGNTYKYTYENDRLATYTNPEGNIWSYGYSESGLLTNRTNPQGDTYQYIYDSNNRVTKEIDEEGYTFEYEYNPDERYTIMADRLGRKTTYFYNESNRVERTVYADGSETFYAYDERNNITDSTNENGETTSYAYNDLNQVVEVVNPLGDITSLSYDTAINKVSEVVDPLGRVQQFGYDPAGNLTGVEHPDGTSMSFTYDSRGLRSSGTDENGNTSRFIHNNLGQLVQLIHADGTTKKFRKDVLGRTTEVVDENGHATLYEYNPLGNITKVTDPLEAITTIAYDNLQRKIRVVNAKGYERNYQYTKRGDVALIIDPLGNTISNEYDGERNQIKKTYPNDTGMQFTFDDRDRKIGALTFPGNKEAFYAYDAKGQRISVLDANGNQTEITYDAAGRPVSKTDAEGFTTSTEYDAVGNLTRLTDANGNSIDYVYNLRNRVVQNINGLGDSTTYEYDGVGNIIQKQQPDASVITHSYNSRNHLIRTNYPDGTFKAFSYDNAGRVLSLANKETKETRVYDAVGRLLITADQYTGQIDYDYDQLGNRIKMMDPDKGLSGYAYDAANRLASFTDPEGGQTTYQYDEMGRVTAISYPNDSRTSMEYNDDNQLVSVINSSNKEGVLSSFAYTYDSVGNKLSVTDESGGITSYQYDRLYQLTGVQYPDSYVQNGNKNNGSDKGKGKKNRHKRNHTPATSLSSSVVYEYDSVGNRVSHTDDWGTTEYSYNAANQMLQAGNTEYSYDANGNRIRKNDNDGIVDYHYNYDNMLVQVDNPDGETTGYGYDALSRRIYKGTRDGDVTEFLYDGLEVLQEITGQKKQKKTTYYRANGRIVTQQKYNISKGNNDSYKNRPDGRQLYYAYDGLGSVASLANHKGKQETRYQYDVFGEVVAGDLSENQYAFTGKRFDPESGFYHFYFRQYDPGTGVWTAPDPIGIMGGINLYSYVQNNPVNFTDFLGLWSSDESVDTEDEMDAIDAFGGYDSSTVDGLADYGDTADSGDTGYFENPDNIQGLRDDLYGPIGGFDTPTIESTDFSGNNIGFLNELFDEFEKQFLFASALTRSVAPLSATYFAMGYASMAVNSYFFSDTPYKDLAHTVVGHLTSTGNAVVDQFISEGIGFLDEKATETDRCGSGNSAK